jgi:hypothetical protein
MDSPMTWVHVDSCDTLPKDLVPAFEEKINNDPYLQRLFQECGAGLPTTCGYQFLWNGDGTDLSPSQYFSCDGLGFAVEIQDGSSHHFLGWVFSHRTTACVVQNTFTKRVHLTNRENQFMVFAWGRISNSEEWILSTSKCKTKAQCNMEILANIICILICVILFFLHSYKSFIPSR